MADERVGGVRVAFFGMRGPFSTPPLLALFRAGVDLPAVVVPGLPGVVPSVDTVSAYTPRGRPLPIAQRPVAGNIVDIARGAGITVYEVERLSDRGTLDVLTDLHPDVICVACFNQRFPPELLRLPPLGCLNVHPSLLPENRGPDPLFWTFKRGDEKTGVTIHVMDEGLDSGPIVAQRTVEVPDGISEMDLEQNLARLGGNLLVEAIAGLQDGSLRPRPQDPARATTYPIPTLDEYELTPDRPARALYNFACGLSRREAPIVMRLGDARFPIAPPFAYDAEGTLDAPHTIQHNELRARCAPGVFTARLPGIAGDE